MNTGRRPPCESKNGLLTTIGVSDSAARRSYALEGSVFVGGAVIQWLRDELRLYRRERATRNTMRGKVPDTGGVYLVPAFTGLGAPHWDMYARGCHRRPDARHDPRSTSSAPRRSPSPIR